MIRGRFVIGLTGSIGMGKSFAASCLRREGIPVFDADAEVHKLMKKGGRAVKAVEAAFPGAITDGSVDRPKLGSIVFGDPNSWRGWKKFCIQWWVKVNTGSLLVPLGWVGKW